MNNSTKFQNEIRELVGAIMGQGANYSEKRKDGRRFKWLHGDSSTRAEFKSRMKNIQGILKSTYGDLVTVKVAQTNNYPYYNVALLGFSVHCHDGHGPVESDYIPRRFKVNPKKQPKLKQPKSCPNWKNNALQFPRLIAEANAMGAFTKRRVKEMAESMDLNPDEVLELVDRAEAEWDRIKAIKFGIKTV